MTRTEVTELELQIARKNNLTLKNIKFFRGHDGMTGLSCDLYQNNKKIAYCFDDARGGEMEISPYTTAHRLIIRNLESMAYNLPEYKVEYSNDIQDHYTFKHTLEGIINALAEEYERNKKMEKDSKKAIVYKDEKGDTWLYSWQHQSSLAAMVTKRPESAKSAIKKACEELEKEGNIILNKDYLIKLGVSV